MALRKLAFGAAAMSVAKMVQLGASFATVPFLARMLAPSDFGLVALAMALTALALAFSDAGLARSLVRVEDFDSDAWSSAFWLIAGAMGAASLILFLLSWPAADFFNTPALTPVMMAIAIIPFAQGLFELPLARLLKSERLLSIASADFFSAVLGAAAAITGGLLGWGVWALVAQNLVSVSVRLTVVIVAARWLPRFVFDLKGLGEHYKFARDNIYNSMVWTAARQIDPFVIGKFLSVGALGFYSVAYRIMLLPGSIVGGPVQNALFSRLVSLRHDAAKLKTLVLTATMAQAAIVFPPMAALAVSSEAVFRFLLGERWIEGGHIFSLLVVGAMVQAVTNFNAPLLQAIGRTDLRFRITGETALVWVIACTILAQFGIHAVALGFSVVTLLYLPRLLQHYLGPIGCTRMEFFRAIAGPVALSLGIVALHLIVRAIVLPAYWTEIVLISVETLLGYGIFYLLTHRSLLNQLNVARAVVKSA